MNKSRKIICCILIAIFMSALFGCNSKKVNGNMSSGIGKKELKFTVLQAPPKCKIIKDKKTIKTILKYVDKNKGEEVKFDKDINGWCILIEVDTDKKIRVIGDLVIIDDKGYKINKEFKDGLKEIYNNISSKEHDYA